MKELSIEEKAKRYDEAIERANERYNEEYTSTLERSTLAYVLPELKENEDGRIRKEMIDYFKSLLVQSAKEEFNDLINNKFKRYISWLEKQGEQKPANRAQPKFKINEKVIHKDTGKIWTIHWYLSDTNSYYVIDDDELIHHYSEDSLESIEQKPIEWSEEDEFCTQGLLHYCEQYQIKDSVRFRCIHWLKSLKDRVQPKTKSAWSEEDERIWSFGNHFRFRGNVS